MANAEELKREYFRKWRRDNPDKVREYNKKWMDKHPEKKAEYNRRYWEKKAQRVGVENASSDKVESRTEHAAEG